MSDEGKALTYYEVSTGICAARGRGWSIELFTLIKGDPPRWNYLPRGGPGYGSLHHEIFMSLHADVISESDLPAGTPEVPETPKGPFPATETFSPPEKPIATKDYPRLASLIMRAVEKRIDCHIVLDDDKLGLAWGDDRFEMFHSAHFSRDEAEQQIRADDNGKLEFSITILTVALHGEAFDFPRFKLGCWEHYRPVQVVAALEDRLAASDKPGEPA